MAFRLKMKDDIYNNINSFVYSSKEDLDEIIDRYYNDPDSFMSEANEVRSYLLPSGNIKTRYENFFKNF